MRIRINSTQNPVRITLNYASLRSANLHKKAASRVKSTLPKIKKGVLFNSLRRKCSAKILATVLALLTLTPTKTFTTNASLRHIYLSQLVLGVTLEVATH